MAFPGPPQVAAAIVGGMFNVRLHFSHTQHVLQYEIFHRFSHRAPRWPRFDRFTLHCIGTKAGAQRTLP